MYEFFGGCQTIDELKKRYRALCVRWHPDKPNGDLATMKRINTEYDKRFKYLADLQNGRQDEPTITETPEQFRHIISELIKLDGIVIELVGTWVWVSGETYAYRAALKSLGFKWSRKRARWYWHAGKNRYYSNSKHSYSELCQKYGYARIENNNVAIVRG